MNFKVLFLYPNIRVETLVPTQIALFTALLKGINVEVDFFDTTLYSTSAEGGIDAAKEKNLIVRPSPQRIDMKEGDGFVAFRERVEAFGPDLIAVTVTESMFHMAQRYLRHIHDMGIPVLMGGVFPTFAPDLALRNESVDMICVGEGEHTLVELCKRMRKGQSLNDVPGLWIKKEGAIIARNKPAQPTDINANPLPDLTIFEGNRFVLPRGGDMWRIVPIETHRGCPYPCTFCNSPAQTALFRKEGLDGFFRKKSLELVRAEIEDAVEHFSAMGDGHAVYVAFWADTFLAWTDDEFKAFCEMYADLKIPFWCQTRIETLTREKITMLKEAGVHRMDFGLEHGNEEFRRDVVKRPYKNSMAMERMAMMRESGIPHNVNNIIGLPGETRELAFETIELNRQIALDTARISVFMPYHGTPLRRTVEEMGLLDPEFICPIDPNGPVFGMPNFPTDEIKGLLRTFNMYVRFPKDRWSEIKRAEHDDALFERLQEEFQRTFYYTSPVGITKEGGAAEALSRVHN